MPVADAPDDEEVRETYNFAPGSHGLVYRADVPDYGAGSNRHRQDDSIEIATRENEDPRPQVENPKETQYKLQAMKWGVWGSLEFSILLRRNRGLRLCNRAGSFLDEAQSRLWLGHEDYQCSG